MKVKFRPIAIGVVFALSWNHAWAGDVLKITLPRHSELTPVQQLNRNGVEAVKRHQYEKAATLFYKAYLYDPADPFTLNNLGYVSELQGDLEHAQKFYALASTQGSNATIDRSSTKELEGRPMQDALQTLRDGPMRVNHMNVDALNLISEHRGVEAVALLHKAQASDPQNPFTLNNLGVAYEALGDYENALRYYDAATALNSKELVIVTLDREWRGKQVSYMAAESARQLKERLKKMGSAEANAALFSVRGVLAVNENNWAIAKQDFLRSYADDPFSAFSLNNRGYVAEMDGDLETAEYFYAKARKANNAEGRVGLATQRSAEGKKLRTVAMDSDQDVDGELERYRIRRRQETGPIELTPRGGSLEEHIAPSSRVPSTNVPNAATPLVPQPQ